MTINETHTIDQSGALLTAEREGCSMPADYSFACVNDYVHAFDRHYEELQALALGMANEIEKLRRDAERYRWLRSRRFSDIDVVDLSSGEYEVFLYDEEMDEAVDAARFKQGRAQ